MIARGGQDRPEPARAAPARHDLDDVLRRALHAAADPVQPADDGLTRILHRLTTPTAVRQVTLLVTDCVDLARLITIWLEPAFTGAMRLTRRLPARYRCGFSDQAARARSRPAGPWLRAALTVASAAMVVLIGVVVLGQVRQVVTPTGLNTGPGGSAPAHSAGGGGQSQATGRTQTGPARPGTTSAPAGRASHRPGTTPTSSSAVKPSGSPAASLSQSPGPTPTASKTNHGHHKPHPSKTKTPPGHNKT